MRGFGRLLLVGVASALVGAVVVLSGPALGVVGGGTPAADDTLTYVAVTPCAVFDSRVSQGASGGFAGPYLGDKVGGVFLGVNSKTLQITGTFPAGQGGGNTDCGIPTSAEAVHINIVAVNALTAGNLVVTDAGGTPPSGGVVNYQVLSPGLNNSNAFNVPLSSGGAVDVYANCGDGCTLATVEARGVVNGYWVPGVDVYESFDRTIVVGGGGTDLENGTALVDAIAAAVAQSPSAADPWLIKVEPGVFDLGTGAAGIGIILPGFVHLAGSGEEATNIACDCSSRTIRLSGGVTQIDDTTITNTNTGTTADGIINTFGATVVVSDSTVLTASRHGISNFGTATITDSHIETTSTSAGASGISNSFDDIISVSGSTVLSAGGGGMSNLGTATITDSRIETTSISTNAHGILNGSGGTVTVSGSTALSAGADGFQNQGIATITNSHIETTSASAGAGGISNTGSITVTNTSIESTVDNFAGAGTCFAVTYLGVVNSFNASSCP